MDSALQLITSRQFDGFTLDCYIDPAQNNNGDFWATRTQIGEMLGYSEPGTAIKNIHLRNKDRLDKFSRIAQVELPSGGIQDVTLYNFKGLLEVCRYSQQPKANAVIDVLWDIADEIRRTGSYTPRKETSDISAGAIDAARIIFEVAGITGNQAALALDKVYKSYTGRSALQAGEITLLAPSQHQLLTPTQIG